jgi:3-deoxy-7-phosphoheptulonate synthase
MATRTRPIRLENINVSNINPIISPSQLKQELPITPAAIETVVAGRSAIVDCLRGRDKRIILVVGPCSIHDPKAYKEYVDRLSELQKRVSDVFIIVQRGYFEKPRTTLGWPGLLTEPYLDGRVDMSEGRRLARELLLYTAERRLPAGTEFTDKNTPQWIGDLVSWAAIGARGVTSPDLRKMVSSLSMPVGFKNTTDGNVRLAAEAVLTAREPHAFEGIDEFGMTAEIHGKGNWLTHIVLRGGEQEPNYDAESVRKNKKTIRAMGLRPRLMIDCSHGNSGKDHNNQPIVFMNVVEQIAAGTFGIIGIMLESHLNAGNQKLPVDLSGFDHSKLKYGVSVTDACVSWDVTEALILEAHRMLARR